MTLTANDYKSTLSYFVHVINNGTIIVSIISIVFADARVRAPGRKLQYDFFTCFVYVLCLYRMHPLETEAF